MRFLGALPGSSFHQAMATYGPYFMARHHAIKAWPPGRTSSVLTNLLRGPPWLLRFSSTKLHGLRMCLEKHDIPPHITIDSSSFKAKLRHIECMCILYYIILIIYIYIHIWVCLKLGSTTQMDIRKIMMIYWNLGVPNVQIHPASPFPHSPNLPELFDHRTLRAMFKEDETGKPWETHRVLPLITNTLW